MDYENMDLEQIETRRAELEEEIRKDGADLDAIEKEIEQIEARKAILDKERETRKAAMDAITSGAGEIITETETRKTMADLEIRNSKAYLDAYAEYIKTGDDKECRALLTENVSNGTVAVPEIVYDIVKTAWNREGVTARVRKSYLKGNIKVSFEISGSDAAVHTEGGDPVSEESLVLGIVTLTSESVKKWVGISDEAYDLRGEAFIRYIYDEITYRIAKKAADELIADIEALGTVSTTTAPGVPVITAATIGLGTIAAAEAALSDDATNPVVIMNKATYAAFKAAQYDANFPVDIFEGRDVIFNNSITAYSAATTGVTYAIVGDLENGALMNFPAGQDVQFKFDDMTLATNDLIRIIGRMYVAHGVIAPNHFVKIKK